MRILTIGGYGFDDRAFFEALKRAGVDTFVDVRQRRGLRGRRYAFLNSTKLQHALRNVGVRYVYLRELAPTQTIRDLQKKDDSTTGTAKRERTQLSPRFVDAYKSDVLGAFDVATFHAAVGRGARAVAFFCVEGHPDACHRSIVAEYFGKVFNTPVEHLEP